MQAQQAIHIDNGEFNPDKKIIHESDDKHPSSKIARANLILTENRLSFDPKLGVFVVRDSEGKHNAVTLFPKQSCTCALTIECYHIISAKMSLGLHSKEVKSVINLSELRRNARTRKEKKSGRKKFVPTTADVINPAPDSLKYAEAEDATKALENNVEECDCKDSLQSTDISYRLSSATNHKPSSLEKAGNTEETCHDNIEETGDIEETSKFKIGEIENTREIKKTDSEEIEKTGEIEKTNEKIKESE